MDFNLSDITPEVVWIIGIAAVLFISVLAGIVTIIIRKRK